MIFNEKQLQKLAFLFLVMSKTSKPFHSNQTIIDFGNGKKQKIELNYGSCFLYREAGLSV
jgi:uncharacterized protein with PIN domain